VCRVRVTAAFYEFYAFSAIVESVTYGNVEGLKVQVPPPALPFQRFSRDRQAAAEKASEGIILVVTMQPPPADLLIRITPGVRKLVEAALRLGPCPD